MKAYLLCLLILLTGLACQPLSETPVPLATESAEWTLSNVDRANPTITHLQVGENELRILHRSGITRLDARGDRDLMTFRFYSSMDFYARPVLSRQFILRKYSQLNNFFVIEPVDWSLRYDGYSPSSYLTGYDVNSPPEGDSSYAAFLNGAESGAVNSWGEFLVAGIKREHPDRITLLALDPYEWFRHYRSFNDARRWEVEIPTSAGMTLRRMQGLGEDYLVSTEQATYLIRRTGDITLLRETGATHAFEMGSHWYAEWEEVLHQSADQGRNWKALGPGAGRLGAGEYFVLDSALVYARRDSLYQFFPQTGALQPLDNLGLDGHQITAVASFADSVYVGTLTGLFTKSHHAFE